MTIDYEELLSSPTLRSRISRDTYARYIENVDELADDVADGKTVLSLGWEVENFGHSGAHWIKRWHGLYFCSSSDYDDEGPFETLAEALEVYWFQEPIPHPSVDCTELPFDDLLKLAHQLVAEEGSQIEINGRTFELESGNFVEIVDNE